MKILTIMSFGIILLVDNLLYLLLPNITSFILNLILFDYYLLKSNGKLDANLNFVPIDIFYSSLYFYLVAWLRMLRRDVDIEPFREKSDRLKVGFIRPTLKALIKEHSLSVFLFILNR